ncbi:dihydrofolate reductase family protein [Humibacter sp. RRB41]|uniref:dihydrofolate reductase family protein n=1 Tax=Humibacter sp. RRB41 TaxID=2919946 RepID=UPI0035AF57DA
MSLDGFVASEREHPGMAIPESAELKKWKLDRISKAGAHLMGRATYQEMSSAWPTSNDPYAAPMNSIPKVVFSTTLRDEDATWPETRVARRDLATEIAGSTVRPGAGITAPRSGREHAVPRRCGRERLSTCRPTVIPSRLPTEVRPSRPPPVPRHRPP